MIENALRHALVALSTGDPERAHIALRRYASLVQNSPLAMDYLRERCALPPKPTTIAGVTFPHRIGLAAGFDKQAEMLLLLEALGVASAEVGSVLPRPQKGNDRPRIFRIPQDEALCNRMGFNSDGVGKIARRLAHVKPKLNIPVGISLSKNKDSRLEDTAQDCIDVVWCIGRLADYWVVNVSSPNTPGLRSLQTTSSLNALVAGTKGAVKRDAVSGGYAVRPLFEKLAPDLADEDLIGCVEAAEEAGADGIILGNTSLRPPPGISKAELDRRKIFGGFSGPHLFPRTFEMLRLARKYTKLPIISCGGIGRYDQAKILFDNGASLIQIYTSFIYQGPAVIKKLYAAIP